MLIIYSQEKQAWRGRRLRAVTLIKSHDPCSVPYLSQFSGPELIGAEVAGSLGGNTLEHHDKHILWCSPQSLPKWTYDHLPGWLFWGKEEYQDWVHYWLQLVPACLGGCREAGSPRIGKPPPGFSWKVLLLPEWRSKAGVTLTGTGSKQEGASPLFLYQAYSLSLAPHIGRA